MNIVNDELYDMHIPHDVLSGWKLMQAVHGISKKLCLKYTDYDPGTEISTASTDSLQCLIEIRAMMFSLKYAIWNNPRDTIKASSLNLMGRLLRRCCDVADKYLARIWETHRDVTAE